MSDAVLARVPRSDGSATLLRRLAVRREERAAAAGGPKASGTLRA